MKLYCHFTGVPLTSAEAWVLDRGVARRRIADLRRELAVLERLIAELAGVDVVRVPRYENGALVGDDRVHHRRRVVSQAMASALAETSSLEDLFERFDAFYARSRDARGRSGAWGNGPRPNLENGHVYDADDLDR